MSEKQHKRYRRLVKTNRERSPNATVIDLADVELMGKTRLRQPRAYKRAANPKKGLVPSRWNFPHKKKATEAE